jgi:hypothetical protein
MVGITRVVVWGQLASLGKRRRKLVKIFPVTKCAFFQLAELRGRHCGTLHNY